VTDDLVVVDQEGAPQGEAGIVEDAVAVGDFLLDVGEEGDVDGSESALGAGVEGPSSVGEVGVDGAADDFAAVLAEVLGLVAELDDFGGADEGEVEGVEEEQQPLAAVVLERELLELVRARQPRLRLEVRRYLADRRPDYLRCHNKIF
jgi:hypothetical protein